MKKVGVAYSAQSLRTLIDEPSGLSGNYELIGLIFAKGGGQGRLGEPRVDLRVYKVFFDNTAGFSFHRQEIFKTSDSNASSTTNPKFLDIDAFYEIVNGSNSNKRAVGYETDRAANYEFDLAREYYSGFFGFAFFTKIDLEILLDNASEVIISTSAIIMGSKVLNYDNAQNYTTVDDSKRFLTFKAESRRNVQASNTPVVTAPASASAPDPGLEVVGVPRIVQGEPCPPHWYLGSAVNAAANTVDNGSQRSMMMRSSNGKKLPPPPPNEILNVIVNNWREFALELYEELQFTEV